MVVGVSDPGPGCQGAKNRSRRRW